MNTEERNNAQIEENTAVDEAVFSSVHSSLYYAGFWMRLWAYLLDLIVISSINGILIYPVFRLFDMPLEKTHMFTPLSTATAITFYLYFILMTKFFKQTIGKMVFGLKVVDLNGGTLTWSTIVFREIIGKFISKMTLLIGFLIIAFTRKKQGIHDMIADTTVIHERTC